MFNEIERPRWINAGVVYFDWLEFELARRGQPSVRSTDFGENTYQISASWDKPITDNFSISYVESPTISIARISFEDAPMRDKCKIN